MSSNVDNVQPDSDDRWSRLWHKWDIAQGQAYNLHDRLKYLLEAINERFDYYDLEEIPEIQEAQIAIARYEETKPEIYKEMRKIIGGDEMILNQPGNKEGVSGEIWEAATVLSDEIQHTKKLAMAIGESLEDIVIPLDVDNSDSEAPIGYSRGSSLGKYLNGCYTSIASTNAILRELIERVSI